MFALIPIQFRSDSDSDDQHGGVGSLGSRRGTAWGPATAGCGRAERPGLPVEPSCVAAVAALDPKDEETFLRPAPMPLSISRRGDTTPDCARAAVHLRSHRAGLKRERARGSRLPPSEGAERRTGTESRLDSTPGMAGRARLVEVEESGGSGEAEETCALCGRDGAGEGEKGGTMPCGRDEAGERVIIQARERAAERVRQLAEEWARRKRRPGRWAN